MSGMAFDEPAAKRSRPTVGSALKKTTKPAPDYAKGVEYWNNIDASVDGVLGGFGEGPVPHIEALSSRLFLLSLVPALHTFASPLTPKPTPRDPTRRLTALDVGAGIGRVTRDVLLPLFDDVVLVEPVEKFVVEAQRQAGDWKDVKEGKRVWVIQGGLQTLDPRDPAQGGQSLGVVGGGSITPVYDVAWCQWCLGHTSHDELVDFLKRTKAALRDETSLIVVKENTCEDHTDGSAREFLDEEDSSLTRSNGKWLEVFKEAGLEVIKEEVQVGMPDELFVVKTYALR